MQQEMEEAQNNNNAFRNHLKWDSTKRATSAYLIEYHFHQILGVEGVPCLYLMQDEAVHEPSLFEEKEQLVDMQMIKDYFIIAKIYLINRHLWNDGDPPLFMYTC